MQHIAQRVLFKKTTQCLFCHRVLDIYNFLFWKSPSSCMFDKTTLLTFDNLWYVRVRAEG